MFSFLNAINSDLRLVRMSGEPPDLHGARPVPGILSKIVNDDLKFLNDVEVFAQRGPPISMSALPAFTDAMRNLSKVGINDRNFLLEKILTLMSRLPDDSLFAIKLQQFFIDILYNDLSHPPTGYLSLPKPASSVVTGASAAHVKYAFRSADGSNYNPLVPALGQAGSPYARSVPSTNVIPKSALPDAGLVFDTFLRRKKFKSHPGGLSNLFFAFADLVIHSIFDTNSRDFTINNVSSYVDLSILYGSSDKDVDGIRRKDGTGMLWDDVFADNRLRFMPPSVGALLILFSRNHNYIARKILNINEWGTYSNPADEKRRIAQDDEIFNRAKLVNCGFFVQIVLGDYVGGILGLTRDGNPWRLNLVDSFRELGHELSPQGQGNVVSLEFNLLYRWHTCVSEQDTKWTEEEFSQLFKDKDLSTLTPTEFLEGAAKGMIPPADVREWTFGGYVPFMPFIEVI
jgi:linoleate 10R-lipoxygenase